MASRPYQMQRLQSCDIVLKNLEALTTRTAEEHDPQLCPGIAVNREDVVIFLGKRPVKLEWRIEGPCLDLDSLRVEVRYERIHIVHPERQVVEACSRCVAGGMVCAFKQLESRPSSPHPRHLERFVPFHSV